MAKQKRTSGQVGLTRGPRRREPDYGMHELLDRTAILMLTVEAHLIEHWDFKRLAPTTRAKIMAAHKMLFDAYQAIGAAHL